MLCCLLRDPSSAPGAVDVIAQACSPRVRAYGADAAVCDVSGLSRVIGSWNAIAEEMLRVASAQGMTLRVAMARTSTAAWLLAHARAHVTSAPPGREAAMLATLSIAWLGAVIDLDRPESASESASSVAASRRRHEVNAYRARFATFERWGLRTMGDLAALPRADILARMGPAGARLHQAACGEDAEPFTPAGEARVFAERLVLEWPIDTLEPLAFVLARLCDRLSSSLEQADRGAITVRTRLTLVTRLQHERALHLPAPIRDARVLRTLILLDLESHPPPAAIDVVEIGVEVAPGRIVQGSLLVRSTPSSESLATLVARLGALMGETRVGAPVEVDTHDARATAMQPFRPPAAAVVRAPAESGARRFHQAPGGAWPFLRRFRPPIAARVTVARGAPVRVESSLWPPVGSRVTTSAGPWRTSGGWWTGEDGWDRDEWDVELSDGGVYRLARDRRTDRWVIEGLLD